MTRDQQAKRRVALHLELVLESMEAEEEQKAKQKKLDHAKHTWLSLVSGCK